MKIKRILIVEDEDFITELLIDYLKELRSNIEGLEFEIDCATNGYEAYNKLQNTNYNLVVTDNRMPIMKGVDLIKAIKDVDEKNKDVEFVLISGSIDEINSKEFNHDVRLISKPFNFEKLEKSIFKTILDQDKIVS